MAQLQGGVGRGCLLSKAKAGSFASLQLGSFRTAGEPGLLLADVRPLRDRAALPGPPAWSWRWTCSAHSYRVRTQVLQNMPRITSTGKSRGPHTAVLQGPGPHVR